MQILTFRRLDFKLLSLTLLLMVISLVVISSTTGGVNSGFFTPHVKKQMRDFGLGLICFFFFATLDYRKLRDWSTLLYLVTILLLIGLFFTAPIQNVRRWYRIPPLSLQPSEFAKIVVVITLSWFLEKRANSSRSMLTAVIAGLIVLVPFALILKQPDLGSALVLMPITLGMFYFGGIHPYIIRAMCGATMAVLLFVFLMFSGVIGHEQMRPAATKIIKEYQYERLNPNTYHGRAGQTAIALGGFSGSGYKQSEFTGKNWLPFAHTDSVFCAFAEQFGFVGSIFLLGLYFALIYFSFQIVALAKEPFGRLLSAGIAVYIAMHVVVNVGMMCGFLPITGVPLLLMTYGGSSIQATMIALGLLQSIYSRRYMF